MRKERRMSRSFEISLLYSVRTDNLLLIKMTPLELQAHRLSYLGNTLNAVIPPVRDL